MDEVFNTIMTKMKKLRKTIVNGHTKHQVMKDQIFVLEREKNREMKVELQVQASKNSINTNSY